MIFILYQQIPFSVSSNHIFKHGSMSNIMSYVICHFTPEYINVYKNLTSYL
ncbi:hypothetical protein PBCV1_A589aL [Paramecium bursaria Chlorella virus 1]|uniref:Uncharacterized protein n=1 Tax=Paramecium bursaria Chlorella virus 1 TaxID=10506 RepID=F8TU64_PBCV1|nr:hypothetical protein PBCV1_A589aL [Paramecium bursaria Chlorella virus 1]AEI70125.1 hypothetical protein [Paramecium bursaria Chlorella virus 1]